MKRRIRVLITISVCYVLKAFSQEVSLADLSFQSTAFIQEEDDSPVMLTGGTIALRFMPVAPIELTARTAFYTQDTQKFLSSFDNSQEPAFVLFEGAALSYTALFNRTSTVTVFTGLLDNPASPSLLRRLFKITVEPCEFHGMPAGVPFSPETEIRGNGLALTTIPFNTQVGAGIYTYWNGETGSQFTLTGDLRLVLALDNAFFNFFGGSSWLYGDEKASFRGGATALVRSDSGHELYGEAGIRSISIGSDDIGKNLYFLFESRLHTNAIDSVFSFFSSPVFPSTLRNESIMEAETMFLGLNALIAWGRLPIERIRTGISFLGALNPDDPGTVTPFSFSVSPFVTCRLSDYDIQVTAVIKPLLLDDPGTAGELRFLLKAVF